MASSRVTTGLSISCAAILALTIGLQGRFVTAAQAPAAPQPSPTGQAPAGPAARQGAPGQPPAPAGRGGGRGNAAATLYTEQCATCHGNDLAGARAPSLFDAKWLATVDDERIVNAIRNGVPNTEMEPFRQVLNDQQIWSLVQYIRTQTASFVPRPAHVVDPNGLELKTAKQTVKVEVVTEGVETPFGIAFLPDGRMLITERPGRLRILDKGKLSEPVKGVPAVHAVQDGGLFDVEVHPNYARNGWIYLAYSEVQPGFVPPPPPPAAAETPAAAPAAAPAPAAGTPTAQPAAPGAAAGAPARQGGAGPAGGGGGQGRGRGPQIPANTVVMRAKISPSMELVEQQVLFRAPREQYTPSGAHYGLRFTFDQQGHLFYSIGERGAMQNAQDLSNALGKIHRVNDDGSVPKDNPFVGKAGVIETIWSYGHRNPQGFAWQPGTGRLWESEHGPSGGDEINIIEKGHNYGWGVATKGIQNGITKTSEPGMDDPIVYYTPSYAPAGISFYTGDRYPGWKNTSLFVGGLVGGQLRRLEIADNKVTGQEVIFDQLGRVRDIIEGPDGYFYIAIQNPTGAGTGVGLATSTPGRIIRLMPVQ
jgi:glucose/arabinose dehydrogenase